MNVFIVNGGRCGCLDHQQIFLCLAGSEIAAQVCTYAVIGYAVCGRRRFHHGVSTTHCLSMNTNAHNA